MNGTDVTDGTYGIASGECFGVAAIVLVSVELLCQGCDETFLYDKPASRRKPDYCRKCYLARNAAATKAWKKRHLLRRGNSERRPGLGLKPLRSYAEVGRMMGISGSYVEEIEKAAFMKLREHPELQKLFREYSDESAETEAGESESGGGMTPRHMEN